MSRNCNRLSGEAYSLCLKQLNGEADDRCRDAIVELENISRGGFRFLSSLALELEDRVLVMLGFPDGRQQEVLGRICYREATESDDLVAYGFSILQGFYKLEADARGQATA